MRATNEKLRQNARHAQLESIYNASHCDSLTARLIAQKRCRNRRTSIDEFMCDLEN